MGSGVPRGEYSPAGVLLSSHADLVPVPFAAWAFPQDPSQRNSLPMEFVPEPLLPPLQGVEATFLRGWPGIRPSYGSPPEDPVQPVPRVYEQRRKKEIPDATVSHEPGLRSHDNIEICMPVARVDCILRQASPPLSSWPTLRHHFRSAPRPRRRSPAIRNRPGRDRDFPVPPE